MKKITATTWLDAVGSGLRVTKVTKDQIKENDSFQAARLSVPRPDAVAQGMAIAKAFAVRSNLVDFAHAYAVANPSYVPGSIAHCATEDGSRPFWSRFDAVVEKVSIPLVQDVTEDGKPSSFPEKVCNYLLFL